MSKIEINLYYDFIYPLALKSGAILLEGYKAIEKSVEMKGVYYDMVTKYDTKIENFLRNEILLKYPNHKFIGEEETAAKNNIISKLTNEPTWIIDPIDGTSNFIKNLPHACVSIGLALNKEIIIGIVVNPILKEIYAAKKGEGAYLNDKLIRVSNCKKITEAIVGYEVSLLHLPEVSQKHIKRIYQLGCKATRTVAYGSVVCSMCYVASGAIDCFHIEDMYPWDSAAASLIIQEAGGIICGTYGDKYDIMDPKIVCGATESLIRDMMELIKKSDNMSDLK